MKMHKKCLAVLLIACCAALPAAGADTGETERPVGMHRKSGLRIRL